MAIITASSILIIDPSSATYGFRAIAAASRSENSATITRNASSISIIGQAQLVLITDPQPTTARRSPGSAGYGGLPVGSLSGSVVRQTGRTR